METVFSSNNIKYFIQDIFTTYWPTGNVLVIGDHGATLVRCLKVDSVTVELVCEVFFTDLKYLFTIYFEDNITRQFEINLDIPEIHDIASLTIYINKKWEILNKLNFVQNETTKILYDP